MIGMAYASPVVYPPLQPSVWDFPTGLNSPSGRSPHRVASSTTYGDSNQSPCFQQEKWTVSRIDQTFTPVTHTHLPYQCRLTGLMHSPSPTLLPPMSTMLLQPTTPDSRTLHSLTSTPTGSKRGRPRADVISTLQYVGSNSSCSIRCHICHRVFPREKSLQAHLRTHTGERPYRCDYPNCNKSFVQSGQLKTHQRLHSGEKPFKCSEEGCDVRFTHANRHCSEHVNAKLVRDDEGALRLMRQQSNHQDETVAKWLRKYIQARMERNSTSVRPNTRQENSDGSASSDDDVFENAKSDTVTDTTERPPVKRRLIDPVKDNSNENVEALVPKIVEIPHKVLSPRDQNRQNCQPVKKRILAYSKRLLKFDGQENVCVNDTHQKVSTSVPPSSRPSSKPTPDPEVLDDGLKALFNKSENYSFIKDLESDKLDDVNTQFGRPSVVVCPKSNLSKIQPQVPTTEERSRWNSALALMELASSPPGKANRR